MQTTTNHLLKLAPNNFPPSLSPTMQTTTNHLLKLAPNNFSLSRLRGITDLRHASYKVDNSRHVGSTTPFSLIRIGNNIQFDRAKYNNFCYSPCSIQLALSFLANGAKGSTLDELLRFSEAKNLVQLNSVASMLVRTLTQSTKSGPILSFASGVWLDQSLVMKPSFKTVGKNVYRSKAETVDFQNKDKEVLEKINQWVANATNGLIDSLLPQDAVNKLTRFVLANALYFKGKWCNPFQKSETKDYNFYLLNGQSVKVPFMTNCNTQFIKTCDNFKVLRLPYEKSDLSMYVLLPNQRDGLWSLAERVGSDPSFLAKFASPDINAVKVGMFKVPKFKITYMFEATAVLQALGLKTCFSNNADFEEMVEEVPGGWIKLENVVHKSYIEVNEEGTEAAAVTAFFGGFGSAPRCRVPRVDFVADHPFMFIIRDDLTGMVMFMGHVVNPLLK